MGGVGGFGGMSVDGQLGLWRRRRRRMRREEVGVRFGT